jgi:hypothetical protein
MTTASHSSKPRPIHTEKIGALSASIWSNTTSEGRTFYSVTIERTYRAEGDELKHARSFNHDDLLNVAKVAERAEAWIAAKMAETRSRVAA